MLWLAGIGKRFFYWGIFMSMLAAPVGWNFLKPYQKQRIMVFLGEGNTLKERYQIEQSKIAIGSGGLIGKGFCNGTQNKLLFLPESRTDFIFSVVCEEWGFCGASIIIMMYLLLFFRVIYRLEYVKTFFGQLLGIGLLIPIALATAINMAMVCGLLPIVGLPLPLMSYGITALWITLASLGWIQGINMRMF
jgi:rod shape determining protein RodA